MSGAGCGGGAVLESGNAPSWIAACAAMTKCPMGGGAASDTGRAHRRNDDIPDEWWRRIEYGAACAAMTKCLMSAGAASNTGLTLPRNDDMPDGCWRRIEYGTDSAPQ